MQLLRLLNCIILLKSSTKYFILFMDHILAKFLPGYIAMENLVIFQYILCTKNFAKFTVNSTRQRLLKEKTYMSRFRVYQHLVASKDKAKHGFVDDSQLCACTRNIKIGTFPDQCVYVATSRISETMDIVRQAISIVRIV